MKTIFISKVEYGYQIRIKRPPFEYKLELFTDFDDSDEEDIESLVHIYKDGVKVPPSYFGRAVDIMGVIYHTQENKPINERSAYISGIATAISCYLNSHSDTSFAQELIKANGLSLQDFIDSGCNDYDVATIKERLFS